MTQAEFDNTQRDAQGNPVHQPGFHTDSQGNPIPGNLQTVHTNPASPEDPETVQQRKDRDLNYDASRQYPDGSRYQVNRNVDEARRAANQNPAFPETDAQRAARFADPNRTNDGLRNADPNRYPETDAQRADHLRNSQESVRADLGRNAAGRDHLHDRFGNPETAFHRGRRDFPRNPDVHTSTRIAAATAEAAKIRALLDRSYTDAEMRAQLLATAVLLDTLAA